MSDGVTVKATDWAGAWDFDGWPFSEKPNWLIEAIGCGGVAPVGGDEDYAVWTVSTPIGSEIATPGDEIVRDVDGQLWVRRSSP